MASNAPKQGGAVRVTYDRFSVGPHSSLRKPQGHLPFQTNGRYESNLANLRDSNAALEAEKTKLSLDFSNTFAKLHKTEQEVSDALEEVASLRDIVSKQKAAIQGLTDQLQYRKDHNVQLRSRSEKTINVLLDRVAALLKPDVEGEQKLAELAKQMEIFSNVLNNARADNAQDKQTIEGLRNSVKKLDGIRKKLQDKIVELTGHHAGDDVEIEQMKKIIADLKAKAEETVARKSASEGIANDLTKQLDSMQKRVDEVTSDDAKDKLGIKNLKTAQENGEKAIKYLETQAGAAKKASEDAKNKALDAEAAKQTAEAVASKAAAERDEVRKPVLPNDVKLSNPIALVGSLKGAARDVDDENFSINCSFPVTLFNTKSNKLYISTNGLFTLDHPSDKYAYQKFPYRGWITQPLPDHVLAPFWADLYIYKGTPQGIYYEETGKAPNRKLEVEWYMSRYSNAKQCYHFTLTVEEAKPNMATFRYFQALDKGGKCTIGIQGPKTSSMFSYNEEKALPGTQVVFDTGKNTFSASTLEVAEVASAVVEMPAAQAPGIKVPNGVSVAVNEVFDI